MTGVSAARACDLFLRSLDHAPAEEHQAFGVDTATAVARYLRALGLIVRLVHLDRDGLHAIAAPCLAQLRDGTWVLLGRRRRSLQVDTGETVVTVRPEDLAPELSGDAIEYTRGLSLPGSVWKSVLAAVGDDSRLIVGIVATAVTAQVLSLATPILTRIAIDSAFPSGAGDTLTSIALGLLLVGAMQGWVTWLRARATLVLRTRLQVRMERGFVDHLLALPFWIVTRRSLGELMQSMGGIGAARELAAERSIGIALDASMALLYLALMIVWLPTQTVVVAAGTLLVAAISVAGGHRQTRLQRDEVHARIRQHSFLVECIRGIATIKALGAEAAVLQQWRRFLHTQLAVVFARQRVGLTIDTTLDLIRQGVRVGVLIWAAYETIEGRLTLGTLVAFTQTALAFMSTVGSLAGTYNSLVILKPQVAIAADLARDAPQPRRRAPAISRLTPVVLDDVWFRYRSDAPWVVSGHHLRVEHGEVRRLAGPSGSGKTTLMRLLAGLYRPERGSVTLGGVDATLQRDSVLYVPQMIQLFSGSILENLELLSGFAPADRIVAAAEASGFDALVRDWPMGYDTWLPAGAGNLSGGQRQLLAVTAAMASERTLLLLDEALANLDFLARENLAHLRWFRDKTIIYASHDTQL